MNLYRKKLTYYASSHESGVCFLGFSATGQSLDRHGLNQAAKHSRSVVFAVEAVGCFAV